ncbi:MAG: HAMP domain-containing histidine kinase [Alphaproteobacteria bacterium]|nr:HAMP domain-containing histidine kinase [Alphaproteobacteria bacterium]
MPTVLSLASKQLPSDGVDFQQVFEILPDPAVIVSPDKRISACNRNFRERFPVLLEDRFVETLHQQFSTGEVIGEIAALSYVEPKRQSIAGGKTWPALQPRITLLPSGGLFIVFKPLNTDELDYVREIGALREQLRLSQERMHSALAAVANCKRNFADAGHELRTPLNAIVGFSDMMRQQTFGPMGDERYQRYTEIIHSSGERLLNAINDVLDFAKLDAGKLELQVEQVEALEVVVDSVRELECLATKSRIGVSVHVCDSVSIIMADKVRLRQMLTNLLSNALKFTPEGGEISIDMFKRRGKVAISVSDTGIGMRDADLPTVMQAFGQVKTPSKISQKGTGLGLPLTKELAVLHGGGIEIESVVGFGTTVTIMLPIEGPTAQQETLYQDISVTSASSQTAH